MKKWVEIKKGGKTTYKLVDKDYEETTEIPTSDLTTGDATMVGYLDIPKDKWNNIFKGE